jgi:hypothetical protein
MMKLSANHFIPWKKLRKKFFYSIRSNQLFRTHDFPCLYMKKKQSSLHNKLEELTSEWLWSIRSNQLCSSARKASANHFIPWKKVWGRIFFIPQDQINCSEHMTFHVYTWRKSKVVYTTSWRTSYLITTI